MYYIQGEIFLESTIPVVSSVFECMLFVGLDTGWDPKTFLQPEGSLNGTWCNIPKQMLGKHATFHGQKYNFHILVSWWDFKI